MTSAADDPARPESPTASSDEVGSDEPSSTETSNTETSNTETSNTETSSTEPDTASDDDLAELAAAEPVDTEQLERSQRAIDEGNEAAAKALDPAPDDEDLDFANVKQNEDPDSADNAVPRPN